MSDSLQVVEVGPERLPVPKGATSKQAKLAQLALKFDPESDTFFEMMLEAGYSPVTAEAQARRTLTSVGVQRATQALQQRQRDRATGLMAVSIAALQTAEADLREMEPRDRLAAGAKFHELAYQTGQNVEQVGDGYKWKRCLHRAIALSASLTEKRLALPPDELAKANARHEQRQMERLRSMGVMPMHAEIHAVVAPNVIAQTRARESKPTKRED